MKIIISIRGFPVLRRWCVRAGTACAIIMIFSFPAAAGGSEYRITCSQFKKHKAFFDDPRPVLRQLSWDAIVPPEDYRGFVYDKDRMCALWKQIIGFAAPGAVGKTAPEIGPGTYSWKDKKKMPGLKKLLTPTMYARFKPGGPPHCGNFSRLTVVPTRQYYYSLPVAEATLTNRGTARLAPNGYLDERTYISGFPFPVPEGRHKAQRIVYNWVKGYLGPDSYFHIAVSKSFDKNLRQDFAMESSSWKLRLHARAMMQPYGWFDKAARTRGEAWALGFSYHAPRDYYGNLNTVLMFLGWDHDEQFMMYVAPLRRVCKLSGTDSHDQVMGMDIIYEDSYLWSQKITPRRNPYTYVLAEQRELLSPAYTADGAEYISSSGLEWRSLRFERRPCYVVKLVQQNPSYVYGERLLYIDRETFLIIEMVNFDQSGRLYRTQTPLYAWHPESGVFELYQVLQCDYIDTHSTFIMTYGHPAPWMARKHVSMRQLITQGK